MPPRYAYWTILIDGKATAFRAKESEELLPTLNQLRRKNSDVVLRYFSRGKLWDSPEQAEWAATNKRGMSEKRGADWRPGGTHKDPRARFDAKRKERKAGVGSRDENASGYREDRRRPPHGDSRAPGAPSKFGRDRQGGWKPTSDRSRENSRPPKPFNEREQRGGDRNDRDERRPHAKPRQDGDRRPGGDRPWSGKPREQNWRDQDGRNQNREGQNQRDQDWRPRENEGRSEGRRPWTPKPRTDEKRPWTGKPGGRPAWSPKGGTDARHGAPKPDYRNKGQNRPREDRPREDRPREDRPREDRPREGRPRDDRAREDRPRNDRFGKPHAGGWSGKPGKKPCTPKPDRRDQSRGSLPSSTEKPRRDDWRTRPDPRPSEKRDHRQETAPKPLREDRAERPPAVEKIGTKPKPPERG